MTLYNLTFCREFHENHCLRPDAEKKKADKDLLNLKDELRQYFKTKGLFDSFDTVGSSKEGVKVDSDIEFDILFFLPNSNLLKAQHSPEVKAWFYLVVKDGKSASFPKEILEGIISINGKEENCVSAFKTRKLYISHLTKFKNENANWGKRITVREHGPALQIDVKQIGKDALWYSLDLVLSFKINEDHYVPKLFNDCHKLLWHYSVSREEKKHYQGIDKGNECRKMCVRMFKKIRDREEGLIVCNSYILKNTLFHLCDEKKQWKVKELDKCFLELLDKMANFFDEGSLKAYFNKDVNILSKFTDTQRNNVRDRLKKLVKNPTGLVKLMKRVMEADSQKAMTASIGDLSPQDGIVEGRLGCAQPDFSSSCETVVPLPDTLLVSSAPVLGGPSHKLTSEFLEKFYETHNEKYLNLFKKCEKSFVHLINDVIVNFEIKEKPGFRLIHYYWVDGIVHFKVLILLSNANFLKPSSKKGKEGWFLMNIRPDGVNEFSHSTVLDNCISAKRTRSRLISMMSKFLRENSHITHSNTAQLMKLTVRNADASSFCIDLIPCYVIDDKLFVINNLNDPQLEDAWWQSHLAKMVERFRAIEQEKSACKIAFFVVQTLFRKEPGLKMITLDMLINILCWFKEPGDDGNPLWLESLPENVLRFLRKTVDFCKERSLPEFFNGGRNLFQNLKEIALENATCRLEKYISNPDELVKSLDNVLSRL